MTIQFTNNASTTLASGITAVATSLTVATGAGALFPTPSGAAFFYCTLQNVAGTLREIVKVTARTTDTFTIVRAQDGTSGQIFSTSDKVELRVTAADLNNFGQLDTGNTWATGQTFVAPVLGTPASGTLINCTFPTLNQNTSGTAAGLSATLAVGSGGTGVATLTGLAYGNGTSAFTAATSAQVLTVVGTVPVGNGGTGITTTPSNGFIPIGNGTNYTAAALTAGIGMGVTNASGSITLNSTGSTINSQTTGYTLVAGDAGKTISITTGGVTVPASVLAAGNIVTIYNNSGSSQTITQGTSLTLQWAGQSSSTTGNRTLGLYGIATLVYISATVAVISGAGLT